MAQAAHVRGFEALETGRGAHCATSSLRSLVRHYTGDAALVPSEALLFGLGGALSFWTADSSQRVPPPAGHFYFLGWAFTFMHTSIRALGLDVATFAYDQHGDADGDRDNNDDAWAFVRDAIVHHNTPVLVCTDTYYLWYMARGERFPGHQCIVVGYDDNAHAPFSVLAAEADPDPAAPGAHAAEGPGEAAAAAAPPSTTLHHGCAYIVEHDEEGELPVARADLERARNPPEGDYGSRNNALYLRSGTLRPRWQLIELALRELVQVALRMVQGRVDRADVQEYIDLGFVHAGLPGLATFVDQFSGWRRVLETPGTSRDSDDAGASPGYLRKCLLVCAQNIAKNGSGGAFFRNTFVSLLQELQSEVGPQRMPDRFIGLAQRSARAWDVVGNQCAILARTAGNDASAWDRAEEALQVILASERELFTAIVDAQAVLVGDSALARL